MLRIQSISLALWIYFKLYMDGIFPSIKWKSKIVDGMCVVAGLVLPVKNMEERNEAITLTNHPTTNPSKIAANR
jgi:hypothetical protein